MAVKKTSKPKGAPDGEFWFDVPPEAPAPARAAAICLAILEITKTVNLDDLENKRGDPSVSGMLARAHIGPDDRGLIAGHAPMLSLLRNSKPATYLVICDKCGQYYLTSSKSVPKTCQMGPAGCDGGPYLVTAANRTPTPPTRKQKEQQNIGKESVT